MEFSESKLRIPDQQPVDRQAVYARVRAALQAGELEQAHRWLRAMLDEDGQNPELWLLLAWTAPSRRSAEVFFKRAQRLQPDHPRARGSAPWSGREWKPSAPGALPETALPRLVGRGAAAAPGMALDSLWAQLRMRLGAHSFVVYLAVYMLGITLAETVTTFLSPHAGLVIHGALLVAVLLHASFWASAAERQFLLALGLAPLIRLMSLSMPLLNFDYMYWYMIIGIPLLVSTAVVYRLGGYRPGQVGLGLGKNLPLQLIIALGGVGLGYLEYLILRPEPLAASLSLEHLWRPALILLVFTGFLEELIFRGLMQRASAEPLRRLGPLYISLLFAVLHIGYQSWVDLLFVFAVGFLFSVVVERTRSIWGVTLAHGLTNITLFLVFPFLIGAPLKPETTLVAPGVTQQAPGATATVIASPTAAAALSAAKPARLPDIFMAPPTPTPRPTQTPAATPTVTPAFTFTPTPCVVNPAWVRYVVQPGDTLASLRQLYNLKKIELLNGSCLPRDLEELKVGQEIYVPFLPPTATPRPTLPPKPTATPLPSPTPTAPPPTPTEPVVRVTLPPPTLPPTATQPPPPTPTAPPPTPTEPVVRPSPTPTEPAVRPSPTP